MPLPIAGGRLRWCTWTSISLRGWRTLHQVQQMWPLLVTHWNLLSRSFSATGSWSVNWGLVPIAHIQLAHFAWKHRVMLMLPSLLDLSKNGPKHWKADWSLSLLFDSITNIYFPGKMLYRHLSWYATMHPCLWILLHSFPTLSDPSPWKGHHPLWPPCWAWNCPTYPCCGYSHNHSSGEFWTSHPNVLFSSLSTLLLSQGIKILQAMESPTPTPRLPNRYPNGPIDETRIYPKIDEFLETLVCQDPGYNLGPMLTKLPDADLYWIDEIHTCTEEKLKGMGLSQGQTDWLLMKVGYAILSME